MDSIRKTTVARWRKALLGSRVLWWIVRDLATGAAAPVLMVGRARQLLWRAGADKSLPAYIDADHYVGMLLEELDPDSPVQLRQHGDPPHVRQPPLPEWGGAGADERFKRVVALAESLRMIPDRAALLELLQD